MIKKTRKEYQSMYSVIDLHCDTILALLEDEEQGRPVSLQANDHQLDLEKMRRGHYLLQCFALFTDRKKLAQPEQQALRLYDMYARLLKENEAWIAPVYCYEDIEANRRAGKISALLTLEEGDVCFQDLAMLRTWHRLGVRMIALTWNYPNAIGWPNIRFDGSQDWNAASGLKQIDNEHGLTPLGIEFVQEMERLHIIIDVSHLSDAGFWDVVKHTRAPFVASHSNARQVCGVSRNLSDEMILAIAKRGGLIGMNYCGDFLREGSGNVSTVKDIADHILYIKQLAGIDCIALGSDFDGINSQLEMKDGSQLPLLAQELQRRGFTPGEIEQVFYKNALRLLCQVL